MSILALDLGTLTGWATLDARGRLRSGLWRLPEANAIAAYVALRQHLREILDARHPRLVAYEDVPGNVHLSGESAHRWGGFEAVVLLACAEHRVPRFLGVNPATWKTAAGLTTETSEGPALAAARRRWPGVRFESADEAVARWVAVAAAERTAR